MFWKKRKPNKKTLLDFKSSNQRNAFRYRHGARYIPEIVFLGKKLNLLDISASGTSFTAENFSAGDSDYVKLDLNDPETKIMPVLSLKINILSRDEDSNVCHCCFENITEEQEELIHRYILNKQKTYLKKRRKRDSSR